MSANGGHGCDHYCTAQPESHGTWHPTKWMVGQPCPMIDRGKDCTGTLVAVGRGSVAANKAAGMVPA